MSKKTYKVVVDFSQNKKDQKAEFSLGAWWNNVDIEDMPKNTHDMFLGETTACFYDYVEAPFEVLGRYISIFVEHFDSDSSSDGMVPLIDKYFNRNANRYFVGLLNGKTDTVLEGDDVDFIKSANDHVRKLCDQLWDKLQKNPQATALLKPEMIKIST